jgi:hypothetical protein
MTPKADGNHNSPHRPRAAPRNTLYGETPQERYRASFVVQHDPAHGAAKPDH